MECVSNPLWIVCNWGTFKTVPTVPPAILYFAWLFRLNTSLQCLPTATRCFLLATSFPCCMGTASNFFLFYLEAGCWQKSSRIKLTVQGELGRVAEMGARQHASPPASPPCCVNNLQPAEIVEAQNTDPHPTKVQNLLFFNYLNFEALTAGSFFMFRWISSFLQRLCIYLFLSLAVFFGVRTVNSSVAECETWTCSLRPDGVLMNSLCM